MNYQQRERLLLARYAMHSANTAGRRHPEPAHPYRACFQRDRDRLVHSAAYRRLSAKTQVFTGELGDYHRTRLTHTHEVASVARTLARALRLNEDLAEALALAHDLGHPPFGHAGEDALDECLKDHGGFCHNTHGLRVVEELEQRYPGFPGLNLSAEVLEGQAARIDKTSGLAPLLEAQVVEASDMIAYNTHDADDAIELGLLTLDELLDIPFCALAAERARAQYNNLRGAELKRALLHELIDWQVSDLLTQAETRLDSLQPASTMEARSQGWIVKPGNEIAQLKEELARFLFDRVYRHPELLNLRETAQQVLREMFAGYLKDRAPLPATFRNREKTVGRERSVGDYIAGMTDRFAARQYAKLFAASPDWRLPEMRRPPEIAITAGGRREE